MPKPKGKHDKAALLKSILGHDDELINKKHFVFNCRCVACGQPSTTVKARDDGLSWCDGCWLAHRPTAPQ